MQRKKVVLRNLAKLLPVICIDIVAGIVGNVSNCIFPAQFPANDVTNNGPNIFTILKPKRIRLPERLPDGSVARGGPFIGPDENVLQSP